jgi:hypothetical protein
MTTSLLPIHYAVIILDFDAVYSELLTAYDRQEQAYAANYDICVWHLLL